MSPSTTAAPGRLLTQVAGERRTGSLVVGGHPGGTVHLLEGMVIYAESPAAPGVGELLTSSGRLAGRTWQAALDGGSGGSRVGQLLVDQGHLTQGELELCVLGAIYDAAYFALSPAAAPVDFVDGATHWLGPVVRVDPAAVGRESRRRVGLLAEIHPHPQVDTAAVVPVPRPPTERVTLTALQWELLVHADGQRTAADLALLLGRAGFATVQELRRLAAHGLIEQPAAPPETGPEFIRLPRARGTAVDVDRPVVTLDDGPLVPVVARGAAAPAPASGDPPRPGDGRPSPASGTVRTRPELDRREPGARLPEDLAGEAPMVHPGTDEVLLKRIRTALRALR